MSKIRYAPMLVFPPYSFLPGVNLHPNSEGGYRFQIADPEFSKIERSTPSKHEALRFSVDLFNHEFFWESHIYLEALWNAHAREGMIADFLKGFIKLTAAGVKFKVLDGAPAQTHLKNAREHFWRVQEKEGNMFLGFDVQKLLMDIDRLTHESKQLAQGPHLSGRVLFEVHPDWDA